MIDKEKVIKGLVSCSPSYPELIECARCPYEKDCYHDGRHEILLRDALTLLREQETIVHCKDCIHWDEKNDGHCYLNSIYTSDDWFCADGEQKGD